MPALRRALAVGLAAEAFSGLMTLVSRHKAVTCGGVRIEAVFFSHAVLLISWNKALSLS